MARITRIMTISRSDIRFIWERSSDWPLLACSQGPIECLTASAFRGVGVCETELTKNLGHGLAQRISLQQPSVQSVFFTLVDAPKYPPLPQCRDVRGEQATPSIVDRMTEVGESQCGEPGPYRSQMVKRILFGKIDYSDWGGSAHSNARHAFNRDLVRCACSYHRDGESRQSSILGTSRNSVILGGFSSGGGSGSPG